MKLWRMQWVSRNNTVNTVEHSEHTRNTPQYFFKKLKQKQHAQNTPQIFFFKNEAKTTRPKKWSKTNTSRSRPEHAPHFLENKYAD